MAPARDGWAPINLQGSPWFSVGSGQAFTYQPARFPVLITTCRLQIERKPLKPVYTNNKVVVRSRFCSKQGVMEVEKGI